MALGFGPALRLGQLAGIATLAERATRVGAESETKLAAQAARKVQAVQRLTHLAAGWTWGTARRPGSIRIECQENPTTYTSWLRGSVLPARLQQAAQQLGLFLCSDLTGAWERDTDTGVTYYRRAGKNRVPEKPSTTTLSNCTLHFYLVRGISVPKPSTHQQAPPPHCVSLKEPSGLQVGGSRARDMPSRVPSILSRKSRRYSHTEDTHTQQLSVSAMVRENSGCTR